jgi:hypothetical protein
LIKPFLKIVNQKSEIVNQFALGVEGENLFELFGRKKFGTKNPPPPFRRGTPKSLIFSMILYKMLNI